ncbi:MAG: hypothetical protein Q9172_000388 [Xanthocarpia lactea]
MPAYSSGQSHYYNTPNLGLDGRKDHTRSYQQRHTPSGSVSPSIPQSLEHPPSTLSSTSGASGQSTASSTVGSPYSLAAHSIPGQDAWAELNQGLGIAPDIVHNDGFPQDAFPSGVLENELCFQDGKFPDSFVALLAPINLAPFRSLAIAMKDQNFTPSPWTPCRRAKSRSGSPQNQRQQAFRLLINLRLLSSMRLFQAKNIATKLQISFQVVAMAVSLRLFHHLVDPSLIQQFDAPISHNTTSTLYPGMAHPFPLPSQTFQPPSPSPSDTSSYDSHRSGSGRFRSGTVSPYLHSASFQPYPRGPQARRLSIASSLSRVSQENTRSTSLSLDEDGKERGRCPNPDCGRLFKDLKAHMLTHQLERPEKCPIVTCEYHQKGFARKYDKNRHTLTHYKGTMVCDFCPGSGSAAEKSFNRADVFKRHLTSLHGVEQTPPNSRKKSPTTSAAKKTSDFSGDAAGKCSTCSAMFSNAQEFYEHLDDCVLRVVQQEEPSESINEQHLTEVAQDQSVLETLDRNMIQAGNPKPYNADEDDEGSETGELKDEASSDWPRSTRSNPRSGKGQIKARRDGSS